MFYIISINYIFTYVSRLGDHIEHTEKDLKRQTFTVVISKVGRRSREEVEGNLFSYMLLCFKIFTALSFEKFTIFHECFTLFT